MSLALTVNLLGDSSNLTRNTKQAEKSLTGFETVAQGVGRRAGRILGSLGAAFAVRKIVQFGVEAAKAAGEDQRAQVLLADQLKRTAKAKDSDIKATEDMISRMEMATGIADDFLRPAMVKLVTVTRNTKKAQDLLKLSLGASAKTGKPLEAVATAVAKAFAGQTTALFRLLPNLKTSKDWMKDLAAETKGLAAQQADPFEKMQRALDRFKEIIGAPIIDKVNKLVSSFTDADWETVNTATQGMAKALGQIFASLGGGNEKLGLLRTIETIAIAIEAHFQAAAGFISMITGQSVQVAPESPLGKAFTMLGYKINKENIWSPGGATKNWNPVGSAPAGGVTNNITIATKADGKTTLDAINAELRRRGLPTLTGLR